MKPALILVGCVAGKRAEPELAKDLYVSELFRRRRAYAEASGRPWLIVSALHGLVDPEQPLHPYEKTLTRASRRAKANWAAMVVWQLGNRFPSLTGQSFELHAGADYAEPLAEALSPLGGRLELPLRGLAIGQQLQWYARQRCAAEPASTLGA